jgi:hypothetical protein
MLCHDAAARRPMLIVLRRPAAEPHGERRQMRLVVLHNCSYELAQAQSAAFKYRAAELGIVGQCAEETNGLVAAPRELFKRRVGSRSKYRRSCASCSPSMEQRTGVSCANMLRILRECRYTSMSRKWHASSMGAEPPLGGASSRAASGRPASKNRKRNREAADRSKTSRAIIADIFHSEVRVV